MKLTDEQKAARLAQVAQAALPVYKEMFTAHCCLNGTRCIIEVLRAFGVQARPVSVTAIAANRVWVERIKAKLAPLDDPDAWAIGVDTAGSGEEGKWPGHLVALVEGRWLLDVSAGQMNRPERNILIPTFFVAEWNGKKTQPYDLSDGGVVEYAPRRYDTSYLTQPGYQLHAGNREIIERISSAVREMA